MFPLLRLAFHSSKIKNQMPIKKEKLIKIDYFYYEEKRGTTVWYYPPTNDFYYYNGYCRLPLF
jgi:hypothetical protein